MSSSRTHHPRPPYPPHPARRVDVPPFDRDAYEQFGLPARLGTPIACWDDPEMVPGTDAAHLRPDDYVIGLTLDGAARAYPMWVIDHYHAINDRVGERRFVVASCERCQSGSAYLADLPGTGDREPLFRGAGVLNAVLLLKDIRTGTWWNHYEGLGLRGRMAGQALPLVPTFHMEWADWLALHPDTTVMAPPADPAHPDARHGHGREEFFSRPGIDPLFVPTISGPLDRSYPENEMVLGVQIDGSWNAFPLREVRREGGVVRREAEEGPVAILAGPADDGFTMSAFRSSWEGRALTLERWDGWFVDARTGTRWDVEGLARKGPLAGARLEPLRWFYVRWHAWIYFHRDTRLFTSRRAAPPGGGDGEDRHGFGEVLSRLAAAGHEVLAQGPPVSQRRPREALAGLEVLVDGDRMNLYRFASQAAARDYEAFEGAWSGHPLRARVLARRLRRFGSLVLESDPPDRFADPVQAEPLSPTSIRWAAALSSPAVDELQAVDELRAPAGSGTPPAAGGDGEPVGFVQVIRALRAARLEVIDVGFLPPGQLRVGCENAVGLTVEGDRFLLYRFESAQAARGYAEAERHAVQAGPFVLRSSPEDMYVGSTVEILFAGEDRIRWSALLDDGRALRALRAAAGEAP